MKKYMWKVLKGRFRAFWQFSRFGKGRNEDIQRFIQYWCNVNGWTLKYTYDTGSFGYGYRRVFGLKYLGETYMLASSTQWTSEPDQTFNENLDRFSSFMESCTGSSPYLAPSMNLDGYK